MLRLDHLAVSAGELASGAAIIEASLGLAFAGGGKHPHMGTHNRVLSLGDTYLEVIAIDPDAADPAWPRWFGLDEFSGRARLTNWICACDDLDAALRAAPAGAGVPVDLQRGDFRWRMAVPASGNLPFDNSFPALIQWQGPHPVDRLPDSGARLARLEIAHPDAMALRKAVALTDPRVVFVPGARAMRAEISTPHGTRVLE